MAYRFLLEVPEKLASEAGVVVATAGDAQVVVARNSHGLGFDDPYTDLTVAAHSLRVIDTIYGWANEIGALRADSRIQVGLVLHDGRRVGLQNIDPSSLVAAIRRDQPWVERYVPKIGEHESYLEPPTAATATATTLAAVAEAPAETITDVNLLDAEDEISIQGRNYAVIQINDLAPAERLYLDLFGMELDQRMRLDEDGVWQAVGAEYNHTAAAQDNLEADIAFMHNGPLNIALSRAGRAARLDFPNVRNEIAVAMLPQTANRLKATVLMRGYTLLTSTGPAYSFRDPFGVVWNIHPHG